MHMQYKAMHSEAVITISQRLATPREEQYKYISCKDYMFYICIPFLNLK